MLAPLSQSDGAQVAHLDVRDDQLPFVAPINRMLGEPALGVHFHAIWRGDEAVGFFKIDPPGVSCFDFMPDDALGLRGLLIGAQYQGKGYGGAAMAALPGYLSRHYTAARAVLSVDETNPVARQLYLANGWVETGQTHESRTGPAPILQIIL